MITTDVTVTVTVTCKLWMYTSLPPSLLMQYWDKHYTQTTLINFNLYQLISSMILSALQHLTKTV